MRDSEDSSTTCTWSGVSSNDPHEEDVILVAMIERVSERFERTAIGRFRVVRLDENLHIDHGLRDDSGYCGRSHVIDAQRRRTERASDVRGRPFVDIGPVRIRRHKPDRHVSTLRGPSSRGRVFGNVGRAPSTASIASSLVNGRLSLGALLGAPPGSIEESFLLGLPRASALSTRPREVAPWNPVPYSHHPVRRYRGFVVDSERWDRFRFWPDDIVISTPAKCGTTWMQTIIGMLVLDRIDLGAPISTISPWLDMLTYRVRSGAQRRPKSLIRRPRPSPPRLDGPCPAVRPVRRHQASRAP